MNKPERIFYFDAIRTIAILCVVLLHVTGHLGEIMNYNAATIYSLSGIYELFANNFFRIGIALYLMLSGALLLGREWNIKEFYFKRITRIFYPFLFWSFVFTVMLVLISYFIPSIHFVDSFGAYDIFKVFVDTLTCKAPGSAIYWFFWTMVGVYLIMPIFNKWINNTDLTKIEYFLIIWAIYIISVYTLMIPIPEIVSFFISPIGFAVLGYYLRYSERGIFNSSLIALIMIIVPAILMLIYSYSIVDTSILFVFNRYSILMMIEAIGVFCLIKNSDLSSISHNVKRFISSIAFCSYGMYLIHSHLIMVTRKILPHSFNFILDYLILFAVGFILSWIIIYILAKIPIVNEFIGVK